MFAPNSTTYQLADSIHHERQSHAALLHKLSRERDGTEVADREMHRRITSRRLAATAVAAVLTFAIAAAAAANQPAASPDLAPANGGGLILIR
jgi:hypothetical protein